MSYLRENLVAVIVGNVAAFVFGMLAINFLIKLISKRGLKDFGWYRIILAVVLAILLLLGAI